VASDQRCKTEATGIPRQSRCRLTRRVAVSTKPKQLSAPLSNCVFCRRSNPTIGRFSMDSRKLFPKGLTQVCPVNRMCLLALLVKR
jgi:hypothetical protein